MTSLPWGVAIFIFVLPLCSGASVSQNSSLGVTSFFLVEELLKEENIRGIDKKCSPFTKLEIMEVYPFTLKISPMIEHTDLSRLEIGKIYMFHII